MSADTLVREFGLSLVLALVTTAAFAQQTVWRWVDEDGVVHMSDTAPEGVEAERITTAPSAAATAIPPAPPAGVSAPSDDAPAEPPAAAPPPATPISEMSLAELDQRCDDAREKVIAPLREAEIEKCKAQPRVDPEWCERHNADFGEGGRTVTGAMRPRMFDDLPECVEALQERNRRGPGN